MRYLESIKTTMNLVMEEALIPVITNILQPVPSTVQIAGSSKLIGKHVGPIPLPPLLLT